MVERDRRLARLGAEGWRERLGGAIWICAVQFFVLQALVQWAWTTPFSLKENYISDLGATVCGPYPLDSANYVCSPWHAAMNLSFAAQAVIILAGGWPLRWVFLRNTWGFAGLGLLLASAPGIFLVAAFAENENLPPHKWGAASHFILSNVGVGLLGIALTRSGRPLWGALSIVCGATGLTATALLGAENYLGLGVGGMERLAAYPVPLWLIAIGWAALRWFSASEAHRQRSGS